MIRFLLRRWLAVTVAAASAAVTFTPVDVVAGPALPDDRFPRTSRVSVGDDEHQSRFGAKFPERPSISASGDLVSFVSASPGLVEGDTNGDDDVFVRARDTRSTLLVSVGNRGQQPVDGVGEAKVSANGRRVVFTTATALTTRDRNKTVDIYMRDLLTARTTLVSKRPDGRSGNGPSYQAHLSRTGRFVVFQSSATNLVNGDANRLEDVFLRDLRTDRTELVSLLPAGYGGQAAGTEPRVSPNGRRVLFSSLNADESTTLWIRNRKRDVTVQVDTGVIGHAAVGSWSMSGSGRYVAFMTDRGLISSDNNGENDAYRVDRRTGRTILLSVGSNGQPGNSHSATVELSVNGQVAAFSSLSSNLVAHDTNSAVDVFRRRVVAGTTRRVSVSSTGEQGNADSSYSRDLAISADGRHVAFGSVATNLVPRDTNDDFDIFVWDRSNFD